jgi:hypothetical protein
MALLRKELLSNRDTVVKSSVTIYPHVKSIRIFEDVFKDVIINVVEAFVRKASEFYGIFNQDISKGDDSVIYRIVSSYLDSIEGGRKHIRYAMRSVFEYLTPMNMAIIEVGNGCESIFQAYNGSRNDMWIILSSCDDYISIPTFVKEILTPIYEALVKGRYEFSETEKEYAKSVIYNVSNGISYKPFGFGVCTSVPIITSYNEDKELRVSTIDEMFTRQERYKCVDETIIELQVKDDTMSGSSVERNADLDIDNIAKRLDVDLDDVREYVYFDANVNSILDIFKPDFSSLKETNRPSRNVVFSMPLGRYPESGYVVNIDELQLNVKSCVKNIVPKFIDVNVLARLKESIYSRYIYEKEAPIVSQLSHEEGGSIYGLACFVKLNVSVVQTPTILTDQSNPYKSEFLFKGDFTVAPNIRIHISIE